MEANPILLQKKYVRVADLFAANMDISPRAALDIFYRSLLYREMSQGISDMHCRSDAYLAEELKREYEQ